MKLSLTIFTLLLVILMSGSILAGPELTIKESSFNFGYVPQQSKITYPFWLYSTGDEPLKIIKVVPGWGCTQAPLGKNELAVGDSTKLEITFDTRNYRRRSIKRPRIQTNEGPFDKYIKIISDIMVYPDSAYPIVISPSKLNTSLFEIDSSGEFKFEIKNVSENTVALSIIYSPDKFYSVSLPKSIKSDAKVEAKIILTEAGITTNFENSFTILADNGKKFRFTIPVVRTK